MSGVVSGAQFAKNPYASVDDPNALGDINAGWTGGESPTSLSGKNLTTNQRNTAWKSPGREALGAQTIGSLYDFSAPTWHEKYKNSD